MSEENALTEMDLDEGSEMKAETILADDYRPAEDEPFMNERQLEYFRRKLHAWKNELLADSRDTIEGLQDSTRVHAAMLGAMTAQRRFVLFYDVRREQKYLHEFENKALETDH